MYKQRRRYGDIRGDNFGCLQCRSETQPIQWPSVTAGYCGPPSWLSRFGTRYPALDMAAHRPCSSAFKKVRSEVLHQPGQSLQLKTRGATFRSLVLFALSLRPLNVGSAPMIDASFSGQCALKGVLRLGDDTGVCCTTV